MNPRVTAEEVAAYQPNSATLAGKIITYYQNNPDEALGNDDIAIKWNCAVISVAPTLREACSLRILQRSGKAYLAGPNLDACVVKATSPFAGAAAAPLPPAPAPPAAAAPKKRIALPPFDYAGLRRESGVEMPVRRMHSVSDPAINLLASFAVGDCTSALPRAHAHQLCVRANELAKRPEHALAGKHFKCRAVNQEHARLWRTQ